MKNASLAWHSLKSYALDKMRYNNIYGIFECAGMNIKDYMNENKRKAKLITELAVVVQLDFSKVINDPREIAKLVKDENQPVSLRNAAIDYMKELHEKGVYKQEWQSLNDKFVPQIEALDKRYQQLQTRLERLNSRKLFKSERMIQTIEAEMQENRRSKFAMSHAVQEAYLKYTSVEQSRKDPIPVVVVKEQIPEIRDEKDLRTFLQKQRNSPEFIEAAIKNPADALAKLDRKINPVLKEVADSKLNRNTIRVKNGKLIDDSTVPGGQVISGVTPGGRVHQELQRTQLALQQFEKVQQAQRVHAAENELRLHFMERGDSKHIDATLANPDVVIAGLEKLKRHHVATGNSTKVNEAQKLIDVIAEYRDAVQQQQSGPTQNTATRDLSKGKEEANDMRSSTGVSWVKQGKGNANAVESKTQLNASTEEPESTPEVEPPTHSL